MKKYIKYLYIEIRRFLQGGWGSWWNFRHGFKASTIAFCEITKQNYQNFVSDVEFQRGHPYNKALSGIIDNKVYLPFLFHRYKEYLPKVLFFKDEFGFLPLECTNYEQTRISADEFVEFLKYEKILVCKHTYSEVGKGFYLLKYNPIDDSFSYNGVKHCVKSEIVALVNEFRDYIVESYVTQHSQIAAINPSSLNTLRLLMVWNPVKRSFVLGRCFQRFGCNGNVVDNLGSGNGVLAYVDIETGAYTGYGVVNLNNEGDRIVENLVHPNSGYIFKGNSVPSFISVREKVVEILNSVSFLKFVALDVAITEDGFKIIETNSYPAPDVAQHLYGFKEDPNFAYFFVKSNESTKK